MLIKRERYYIKRVKKDGYITKVGKQNVKQTSFWLFGIIPLYIKNEIINGDYESCRTWTDFWRSRGVY